MGQAVAEFTGEQRTGQRVVLGQPARFVHEGQRHTGFGESIGVGGIFVVTYHIASVGSLVDLEFSLLDGGSPVASQAEVLWTRPDQPWKGGNPGLGLQFVRLDEPAKTRIERFVRRHAQDRSA